MNIGFSDSYTTCSESGRYIFWATVNDQKIPCEVSDEALQDYIPSDANTDIEELFRRYKADLENIAEKKIRAPEFNWRKVLITTSDME